MGWGGRGISLINKGVDFDGTVCVLFCVRQDENHALVALAVQIMCYYACALLGAVSVLSCFVFLLPLGRSLHDIAVGGWRRLSGLLKTFRGFPRTLGTYELL